MAKCSAITRTGARCRGIAIDASGLCHAHHPDRAEKRKRAGHKGGKRGGRGRPGLELVRIKERIEGLADDVLDGRTEKGTGAVVSQILNVYLRAMATELKVREQQELEERLVEIEEALERQQSNRWGRSS